MMFNNTTGNTTFVVSNVMYPANVIVILFLSFILLMGVFGNLFVVYIFSLRQEKKIIQRNKATTRRFESFLKLLAIIDLISSFIFPTTFIYLTLTHYQQWDFGYVGCKMIPPLLQISITISHGVLILISYERYQTIVHPFKERVTTYEIRSWLCFTVLISIVFAVPYSITLDIVNSPEFHVNTCLPRSDLQSFQLLSACIYLGRDMVAIIIMLFLYVKTTGHLTKEYNIVTWDRGSFSKKGRRLLKTVLVVFVCLTLPFDIYQVGVLSIFVGRKVEITAFAYEIIMIVNTLLQVVQSSNSVSNVFIYSKLHSNFRRRFIKCCDHNTSDEVKSQKILTQEDRSTTTEKRNTTKE